MGDLSKRFLKERKEEEIRRDQEAVATERRQKRIVGRYSRVGLGVTLGAVLIATPLILSAVAGEQDPFANIKDKPATVVQDSQSSTSVSEVAIQDDSKRVFDCGPFKVVSKQIPDQEASGMPAEDYEVLKDIQVFADGTQIQGFDPRVSSYSIVYQKYHDGCRDGFDWSFQGVPEGWTMSLIEDSQMAKSFMNMECTGFSAEASLVLRSDDGSRAYTYEMGWGAGATLPLSADSLNTNAIPYYAETQEMPESISMDSETWEKEFTYDNGTFRTVIPESERDALGIDSQDEDFAAMKDVKVLINGAPLLGFDPRVHTYNVVSDDYDIVKCLANTSLYAFQGVPEGWVAEVDEEHYQAVSCNDMYGGVCTSGDIRFNIGHDGKVEQFTVHFGYTSPGFGHAPTAEDLLKYEQQPETSIGEPPLEATTEPVDASSELAQDTSTIAYPDNGTFKTAVPEVARRAVSPVSDEDADALKGVKVLLGGIQVMGFDPQTHGYDLVFTKHDDAMGACDNELSFQDVPEGWVAEEVPESRLAKSFITEWLDDEGNHKGYTGMSAEVSFVLRSTSGTEYTYRLGWGSGTSTPRTADALNDDPRVSAPSLPEMSIPTDGTPSNQGSTGNPTAEPLPAEVAPSVTRQSAIFQECDDDAIVSNVTGYYERHQFSYATKPLITLQKGCGDVTTHMYVTSQGSFGEATKGEEYSGKLLETVTVDEGDHLAVYVRPTKLGEAHSATSLGDVIVEVEVAENEQYEAFSRTWRMVTDKLPLRIQLQSAPVSVSEEHQRLLKHYAKVGQYYTVPMLSGDAVAIKPDATVVGALSNPYPEWNVLPDSAAVHDLLGDKFRFSVASNDIEVDPVTGVVKASKLGTYRIQVSREADNAFATVMTYADIEVLDPSSLKKQPTIERANGRAETVVVTYAGTRMALCSCAERAGAVTAKSSNDAIAKPVVNGHNVEMILSKPGTATITVGVAENDQYAAAMKKFTVIVGQGPTKLTLANASVTVGKSFQISGRITTSTSTEPLSSYKPGFTYKSSAPEIASVSSTGKVTARKVGKATITVSATGTISDAPSTATMTVTVVDKKVPSIKVISENGVPGTKGPIGWYVPLCKVTDGAGKVTATSSNTRVASIDSISSKPTVVQYVAKAFGTSNITVKVAGNSNYQAVTKTFKVTVGKNSVNVSVKKNVSVKVKKTKSLGVNLHEGANGEPIPLSFAAPKITYSSTNSSVASVDKKGKITGRKAGKATIVIKTAATTYYKATTTKVAVTVTK